MNRRVALAGALLLSCSALAACGEETEVEDTPCAPSELKLGDGRCQPPGLPLDMPCEPGETPLDDGSCQAAGVPPSQCGDGFDADGQGGCKAVVPSEPCPSGLMAIPGDTECHEVAPCGTGTWGDIPSEDDTQFVDGSYAGNDSDGTQERPWKTIQDGADAAANGAIVAVAAGTYNEDVALAFKPRRLWGRCPSMVTIEGVDPAKASVRVSVSGVEIHGAAITGPGVGVAVVNAEDVLVDGAWVHDTEEAGLLAQDSSVTVRGSLFERARKAAMDAFGATLIVERTAARNTRPTIAGPEPGYLDGVLVGAASHDSTRSNVTVRSSLLERALDGAIALDRSDLALDGVAVRVVAPAVDDPSVSIGLLAMLSSATIRGSTFEAMAFPVALLGSQATLERASLVHSLWTDIAPEAQVALTIAPLDGTPSNATVRMSAIADNPGIGIGVYGSSALVESTLLRGNGQNSASVLASAIQTRDAFDTTIRRSSITGNQFLGLGLYGSDVLLEESTVRDMLLDSISGACVMTTHEDASGSPAGTLTVRSSLIEHCVELGVGALESNLVMETSVVRDVLPRLDGKFGDGVVAASYTGRMATAKLVGVRIESAARAGVSAFGGQVDLGLSSVSCADFDLAGEEQAGMPFMYNKLADNVCGCPDPTALCEVQSPGLEVWQPPM
jgi:hypothetical protein